MWGVCNKHRDLDLFLGVLCSIHLVVSLRWLCGGRYAFRDLSTDCNCRRAILMLFTAVQAEFHG
jgi:hypothetical protein